MFTAKVFSYSVFTVVGFSNIFSKLLKIFSDCWIDNHCRIQCRKWMYVWKQGWLRRSVLCLFSNGSLATRSCIITKRNDKSRNILYFFKYCDGFCFDLLGPYVYKWIRLVEYVSLKTISIRLFYLETLNLDGIISLIGNNIKDYNYINKILELKQDNRIN